MKQIFPETPEIRAIRILLSVAEKGSKWRKGYYQGIATAVALLAEDTDTRFAIECLQSLEQQFLEATTKKAAKK